MRTSRTSVCTRLEGTRSREYTLSATRSPLCRHVAWGSGQCAYGHQTALSKGGEALAAEHTALLKGLQGCIGVRTGRFSVGVRHSLVGAGQHTMGVAAYLVDA